MTRFGKARPSPAGAPAQAPPPHHPRAPTRLPVLNTGRHRPPWTLRTKFKDIVQLALKPRDGAGTSIKALSKHTERVRTLCDEVLALCLSANERYADQLVEEALQLKPRQLERVLDAMDKAGAVLLADFLRLATHIEDIYQGLQSGASPPAGAKATSNDLALDTLRAVRAGHGHGHSPAARGKGPSVGASRRSPPPITAAALPRLQASPGARPATAASAGSRPATAVAFGSWPPVTAAAWGSRPATGAALGSRPATAAIGSRPATATSAGSRPTTASRMPQPFRTLLLADHQTEEQASVDDNLARLLSPRLAQVAFAAATAREPRRSVSRQLPLSHRALLKAVSSETFRSHVAGLLPTERETQAAAAAWRGGACPEQEAYLNLVQALMLNSRGSPHGVQGAEQADGVETGGGSPSSTRLGQLDPRAGDKNGGPGTSAAAPRSRKGSTMPATAVWALPHGGGAGVEVLPGLAVEKSLGSGGKPWRAKGPGKASLADSPIILRSLAQECIVDSFML